MKLGIPVSSGPVAFLISIKEKSPFCYGFMKKALLDGYELEDLPSLIKQSAEFDPVIETEWNNLFEKFADGLFSGLSVNMGANAAMGTGKVPSVAAVKPQEIKVPVPTTKPEDFEGGATTVPTKPNVGTISNATEYKEQNPQLAGPNSEYQRLIGAEKSRIANQDELKRQREVLMGVGEEGRQYNNQQALQGQWQQNIQALQKHYGVAGGAKKDILPAGVPLELREAVKTIAPGSQWEAPTSTTNDRFWDRTENIANNAFANMGVKDFEQTTGTKHDWKPTTNAAILHRMQNMSPEERAKLEQYSSQRAQIAATRQGQEVARRNEAYKAYLNAKEQASKVIPGAGESGIIQGVKNQNKQFWENRANKYLEDLGGEGQLRQLEQLGIPDSIHGKGLEDAGGYGSQQDFQKHFSRGFHVNPRTGAYEPAWIPSKELQQHQYNQALGLGTHMQADYKGKVGGPDVAINLNRQIPDLPNSPESALDWYRQHGMKQPGELVGQEHREASGLQKFVSGQGQWLGSKPFEQTGVPILKDIPTWGVLTAPLMMPRGLTSVGQAEARAAAEAAATKATAETAAQTGWAATRGGYAAPQIAAQPTTQGWTSWLAHQASRPGYMASDLASWALPAKGVLPTMLRGGAHVVDMPIRLATQTGPLRALSQGWNIPNLAKAFGYAGAAPALTHFAGSQYQEDTGKPFRPNEAHGNFMHPITAPFETVVHAGRGILDPVIGREQTGSPLDYLRLNKDDTNWWDSTRQIATEGYKGSGRLLHAIDPNNPVALMKAQQTGERALNAIPHAFDKFFGKTINTDEAKQKSEDLTAQTLEKNPTRTPEEEKQLQNIRNSQALRRISSGVDVVEQQYNRIKQQLSVATDDRDIQGLQAKADTLSKQLLAAKEQQNKVKEILGAENTEPQKSPIVGGNNRVPSIPIPRNKQKLLTPSPQDLLQQSPANLFDTLNYPTKATIPGRQATQVPGQFEASMTENATNAIDKFMQGTQNVNGQVMKDGKPVPPETLKQLDYIKKNAPYITQNASKFMQEAGHTGDINSFLQQAGTPGTSAFNAVLKKIAADPAIQKELSGVSPTNQPSYLEKIWQNIPEGYKPYVIAGMSLSAVGLLGSLFGSDDEKEQGMFSKLAPWLGIGGLAAGVHGLTGGDWSQLGNKKFYEQFSPA